MRDLEWRIMRDFLESGNMGSWEFYRDLTMDEPSFEARYPSDDIEE